MANENEGYTYLEVRSPCPTRQILNLDDVHVEPAHTCTLDAQIPCSASSAANDPIDSLL